MKRKLLFITVFLSPMSFAQEVGPQLNRIRPDGHHEGISLTLTGGMTFESFSTSSSSGFAPSVGTKNGMAYGLEAAYQPEDSAHRVGVSYRRNSTEYTGLTGLTPSAVTLIHDQVQLFSMMRPWKESLTHWRNLSLGLALGYQAISAEITVPNAVVIPRTQMGIYLLSQYLSELATDLKFDARFRVELPFYTQESGSSSGSYQYSLATEFQWDLVYTVSDLVDIGVGLMFRLERSVYTGTGTNGSVDASHGDMIYGVPLVLRFKF